jgi:hypothetical protein
VSSGGGSLREVWPVAQGDGLVVEGAGLQAAVQDADQPVREPPQGVVVLDVAGAQVVVEGAGSGRGIQGGEGLRVEGVDEPVVADEPGGDDLFPSRGAGDRAGAGVVAAGLTVGVAARLQRSATAACCNSLE